MTRSPVTLCILVLAASACATAPPPDSLCAVEPIPATTRVAAGQGAALVGAPTEEYAYFQDQAGKQIAAARLNQAEGLQPGEYRVLVNKSTHQVSVQAGMLTRCVASTLKVTGATEEYYYVFDTAGSQLAAARLNATIALFPGQYDVRVNTTRTAVELGPQATIDIKAGTLEVRGATEEYYYVFDSAGTQLTAARLNAPKSLLAGDWSVKVNNTAVGVKVTAAETTRVETGTLTVQGATDEYYYVFDDKGTQLVAAKLGRPVSLFPGGWQINVNNTKAGAKVAAAEIARVDTGTLTVNGSGNDYYYVLDSAGQQLAASKINSPVALVAGDYTVRIGQQSKPASVAAGENTALAW